MVIGIGLVINILLVRFGYVTWIDWWFKLDTPRQVWAIVILLIVAIILAFILQAFSTSLVRSYAGFNGPDRLRRPGTTWQRRQYETIRKRQVSQIYDYFPENESLMQPTAFGNRLQAADEYAYRVYKLDSTVWWPRLTAVFPEAFRQQIDGALTPMLALLNLCTLLSLTALSGIFLLIVGLPGLPAFLWFKQNWILALVLIGGHFLFAAFCYLGVLSQVQIYSAMVRAGFDLYRHELLRQMRIPLPDSLAAEQQLWPLLTALCLFGDMPWSNPEELQEAPPQHKHYPFYFDTYKPPALPQPDRIELKISQTPDIILRQREDDSHQKD